MSIIATNVSKIFGVPPVKALSDITLEIKEGEFVALTGKSGSGKSTLLYLLSSLDEATEGKIEISGHDLKSLSQEEICAFRNREMGFVFQFHYLISELTSIENILLPALKSKMMDEKRDYAKELLKHFDLGDKLDRLPGQLSGGEQQRIAIARALIMRPKYLFADEPTGSLDSANGQVVMKILKEANENFKTTIIMVTHDLEYAANASRQIQLHDGRIMK